MRTGLISVLLLAAAGYAAAEDRASREAVEALKAYAVFKMAQYDEAYRRFLALAEKGNTQGMLNVANMLLAGQGVTADPQAAFDWYRKAADTGHPIGMYYTGRAYEFGQGVTADAGEAERWYRQAAARDSTEAQLALGKLLMRQGKADEGREWVRRSADNGDVVAQRYLAQLSSDSTDDGGVTAGDRALIKAALAAVDRAAQQRNAPGVVYFLDHRARVRVRLPGAADWIEMGKSNLRELWQKTFDEAADYQIQRSAPVFSVVGDRITVNSTIDETVHTDAGARNLRLHETARLRIVDDSPVIDVLALEIERR